MLHLVGSVSFAAANHPRGAEAVNARAETDGPEGFFDRHLYCPALCQEAEDALRLCGVSKSGRHCPLKLRYGLTSIGCSFDLKVVLNWSYIRGFFKSIICQRINIGHPENHRSLARSTPSGTSASGNWCWAIQQARICLLFREYNMRRVSSGLVLRHRKSQRG